MRRLNFFWNTEVVLHEMDARLNEYIGIVTPITFTYYGVSYGDHFFGVVRAIAS